MRIIGIDEVGRGPLAGPVLVCALSVKQRAKSKWQRVGEMLGVKLKDSKKLSPSQREAWCAWIKNQDDIYFAIARVQPKTIDRINIREATNLAATRALGRVGKLISLEVSKLTRIKVLLDGGIYINKGTLKTLLAIGYTLNPKTIIGGDDTIPAIQLASIVAKVTRDNYMKKLHKKFPQYGFDVHKGYGTRMHYRALKKYGRSPEHRKSFLKNIW